MALRVGPADRAHLPHRDRHPGPLQLPPRPGAADRPGARRRRAGPVHPARPARGAGGPGAADRRRPAVPGAGGLPRPPRPRRRTAASGRGSATPARWSRWGEPHIAPWWFPANDHPRDKATLRPARARPARPGGGRQRAARRPRRGPGLDLVALAQPAADGAVPRVLRGRRLPARARHGRRHAVRPRRLRAAHRRAAATRARADAPDAAGAGLARAPAGRLPVRQHRRADHLARTPASRWRTRPARPTRTSAGRGRTGWSPTSSRTSGSVTRSPCTAGATSG